MAAAGPRAAQLRASTRSSSSPCGRATCSTTGSRACSPATTTTSPCSPATIYMRSGIERLAALGDADAVGRLADLISRCAQLHAEGREDEVAALWRETAEAIAGA